MSFSPKESVDNPKAAAAPVWAGASPALADLSDSVSAGGPGCVVSVAAAVFCFFEPLLPLASARNRLKRLGATLRLPGVAAEALVSVLLLALALAEALELELASEATASARPRGC